MKQIHLLVAISLQLLLFSCTQQNVKLVPSNVSSNVSQLRYYNCSCGGILNVTANCDINYANPNNQSIGFQWEGFQSENNYRMYIKDASHQTVLLKENLSGLGYTTPAILASEVFYKVEIVAECENGSDCTVYSAYYKITSTGGGPIIIVDDI